MTTVTTVDAQIYNDPVTLATGTTTFAGSAITFNGTVTGATNDLIVNTTGTGTTAFNGNVSTKSLTTNADGTTAFGATVTTVTTVDAQIYNDPVTLATGGTTFAGSAITFNGTVTGATNDLIVSDRHRRHRLQRQRQHQEPHHRRRRHHRLRRPP